MAQDTGAYLTRFEDYYKSSDDSGGDSDASEGNGTAESSCSYFTESEEEDHQIKFKDEEGFMKKDGGCSLLEDSKPLKKEISSDYVEDIDQFLMEMEETEAEPSDIRDDQLTSDYADLLKTVCKICGKTVEMDTFR